jgi:hypothetical protein
MAMKPIKITTESHDAIEAALHAVNGRAVTHTFRFPSQILDLAEAAERGLINLGIPKVERAGARFVARSGEKLPSAYKYVAIGTHVTLLRRSGGWYLIHVVATEIHPGAAPRAVLELTPAQDARAVEVLRRSYRVPEAVQAAARAKLAAQVAATTAAPMAAAPEGAQA